MIEIKNKSDCCGCTACYNICPKDAISMANDELGFLYPVVDNTKCINCHLCEHVCSFNSHYDTSLNFAEPICYGARHKNISEVRTSRSGGVFISLSNWIIKNNGTVYGAAFDENYNVLHKRATDKKELDEFKGSKYVQSNLDQIFKQVKNDLTNGLFVLFSGTPCQTAGLNSYIGKHLRKNLFLIDIVCHGVPSPAIWKDNLDYINKKVNDRIIAVNFRDKEKFGWKAHKETYLLTNGAKYVSTIFTKAFYKHIMLRDSCEKCFYTNLHRPSDITLADFWRWERSNKNFNKDNLGCSLILVNTPKGKLLFDNVSDDLIFYPVSDYMQPHLISPTKFNPKRKDFINDYCMYGFEYTMRKYECLGFKATVRTLISDLKHKIIK